MDPLTVKFPERVKLTAVASPVSAGEANGAFKSKAVRVAEETGSAKSEVLSTFESPTEDFVSAETAVETAAYRVGKGSGKRAMNPAQALQPLLALEVRRAIQARPRPQPRTGAGR